LSARKVAVVFRFVNEDGPTGWIGVAVASDWTGIFHTVDEFGDPGACEYRPLPMGSGVCWHEDRETDGGPDIVWCEPNKIELSERVPNSLDDEKRWRPFPVGAK
jgi:hypothetical protein